MKILSPEDTCKKLGGIGRTLLWELSKDDPAFPKPIEISRGRIGYIEGELDRWIETRAARRDERLEETGKYTPAISRRGRPKKTAGEGVSA